MAPPVLHFRRIRRALRILLLGLACSAGLVLVLLGLAFCPPIQDLARPRLVALVNQQIQGRLEIEHLRLLPWGKLSVEGVTLSDPQSRPVARIHALEVWVRLGSLLHHRLEISRVQIDDPHLVWLATASGSGLLDALAPRKPSPPAPPPPASSEPSAWTVWLDDLGVTRGDFTFASALPGTLRVAIDGLQITSGAQLGPGGVSARLRMTGRLREPIEAPLAVDLDADGSSLPPQGQLALRRLRIGVGPSEVVVSGQNVGGAISLMANARVTPLLAQALGAPLSAPVEAHLEGQWDGHRGTAVLTAPSAEGPMRAEIQIDQTWAKTTIGLDLALRDLDPSVWLSQAPPARINGRVRAEADLSPLADPDIRASVALRSSVINGEKLDSLLVHLRTDGKQVALEDLAAHAGGASLLASGTASADALDVGTWLNAPDLGSLARLSSVPGWAGSADLTARISGSPAMPFAEVHLLAPSIAGPGVLAQNLTLDARATPLAKHPRVETTLTLKSGEVSGIALHGLTGRIFATESAFAIRLATAQANEVHLNLAGHYLGKTRVGLDHLVFGLGAEHWHLTQPAQISFGEGVQVTPLTLQAGLESLALEGSLRQGMLDAHLQAANLNLGGLPATLLPSLDLAGSLSFDVVARGPISAPDVQASVHGRGLAAKGFRVRSVDVDGQLRRMRLRATLQARADAGAVDASVDAPLAALKTGKITAKLTGHVDLAQLAPYLKASPDAPPSGQADVALTLSGSAAHPTGDLALQLNRVSVSGAPPISGTVHETQRDRQAALDVALTTRQVHLDAKASATLPERFAIRPDLAARLEQSPFEFSVHSKGFSFEHWRHFLGLPRDAAGAVDLDVEAHGPLATSAGTVKVVAGPVTMDGIAIRGATLDLVGTPSRLEARAQVDDSSGARAFELEGRLDSGVKNLVRGEALAQARFQVTSKADVDLARLDPASGTRGSVSMALSGSGTLSSPQASLQLGTHNLQVGARPLPDAKASASYRVGKVAVALHASQLELEAHADARLGLGVPPPDVRQVPFTFHFKASKFDLAALEGMTPDLESLGGTLDGEIEAHGTAKAPDGKGTLDLQHGRLIMAGMGDFEDVGLHLDASRERIALTHLDVKSGRGKLHLDGAATRQSNGTLALTAAFSTDKFPLLYQDQLLAMLQVDSHITGNLGGDSLVKVNFKSIHLDVPSLSHKDVQKLAKNPEVVFVHTLRQQSQARAARTPHPKPGATKAAASSGAVAASGASPAAKPLIRVGIYAPSDFWIRGADMNLDLEAALGLQYRDGLEVIDPPDSKRSSRVQIDRGHIDVIGRRFDIPDDRPSKVVFHGGDFTNADLDVKVIYKDAPDNVNVTVAVTGPLSKPNPPTLTSDPPLDSSSLAFLLATGHLQEKRGASGVSTAQAASVLGSLIASQAQAVLRKKLPLDTLTIQSSDQGVLIQAGVYLNAISNRLYMAYTHNVITGTETEVVNLNELQLQYQLSKRWNLEAYGGDAGKGGAGAMWTKDY